MYKVQKFHEELQGGRHQTFCVKLILETGISNKDTLGAKINEHAHLLNTFKMSYTTDLP